MIKKSTPVILSVALCLGSSMALADQNLINSKKKIAPQAVSAQKRNKIAKKGVNKTALKNNQAENAAKKIELTSDRKIIQRKGPGHVA